MKTVQVIFFDIGGVLLTNGWGHLSRKKAAERFKLNFEEVEVLHHYVFNLYEIGHISLDEYIDTVIFNHPRDFSRDTFRQFMLDQSEALEGMLDWLKAWKRDTGMRILSLNNEGRELNTHRIAKFGLHECFDAFISSCDVGMRKPDPGIYRLACRIAQVPPDACLYFDDRQMLVDSASRYGLRAFHHQSFEATRKFLERLIA